MMEFDFDFKTPYSGYGTRAGEAVALRSNGLLAIKKSIVVNILKGKDAAGYEIFVSKNDNLGFGVRFLDDITFTSEEAKRSVRKIIIESNNYTLNIRSLLKDGEVAEPEKCLPIPNKIVDGILCVDCSILRGEK